MNEVVIASSFPMSTIPYFSAFIESLANKTKSVNLRVFEGSGLEPATSVLSPAPFINHMENLIMSLSRKMTPHARDVSVPWHCQDVLSLLAAKIAGARFATLTMHDKSFIDPFIRQGLVQPSSLEAQYLDLLEQSAVEQADELYVFEDYSRLPNIKGHYHLMRHSQIPDYRSRPVETTASHDPELIQWPKNFRLRFWAFHNKMTGGARVFFRLANELKKATSWDIKIFATCPAPGWIPLDVPWVEFSSPETIIPALNQQSDLVVVMYWMQMHDAAKLNVPKVLLEQGDPVLFDANVQAAYRDELFTAYKSAIPIVAVSDHLRSTLGHLFNVASDVWFPGIDYENFYPRNREFLSDFTNIILVGDDAMAFKGILESLGGLSFVSHPLRIIQSSPGCSQYARIPVPRILFCSPARERLGQLFRVSALYLGCSWYESFPLPPLEAMGSGTVVLSSNNGGILQYGIDGRNIVLIDNPANPRSIGEVVDKIIENRDLYLLLQEEGFKTARRYAWPESAKKFAELSLRLSRTN